MNSLKAPFSLAAILEENAQAALENLFVKNRQYVVRRLMVAHSEGKAKVSVTMDAWKNIGDISNTKAFAECRSKLMEDFPDVADVRQKKSSLGIAGDFAKIEFDLKAPALKI